jgi:competence ComEA-like helix-hairpin-helix protein
MVDKNSKININTAEAAELELIKGVGEILGKCIVEYREDNGPFKSLDDLVKVGGVGRKKLSAIRDQICIENQVEDLSLSEHEGMDHDGSTNDNYSKVNTQFRESMKYMLDILEPIVKATIRPQVPQFNYRYSNKGVVRIASWNVERFDEEKANNPGVKEVMCMTILENG